ncbi:unnamed protein product [Agarophyton chilense]
MSTKRYEQTVADFSDVVDGLLAIVRDWLVVGEKDHMLTCDPIIHAVDEAVEDAMTSGAVAELKYFSVLVPVARINQTWSVYLRYEASQTDSRWSRRLEVVEPIGDDEIQASIADIEKGKHRQHDLFVCAKPSSLELSHLKRHSTVLNVKNYADSLVDATKDCDLHAWQTGVCNATIPNQIPISGGFIVESIVTEVCRRCAKSFPHLEILWASPYQISTSRRSSIVTIELVTIVLERDDYIF